MITSYPTAAPEPNAHSPRIHRQTFRSRLHRTGPQNSNRRKRHTPSKPRRRLSRDEIRRRLASERQFIRDVMTTKLSSLYEKNGDSHVTSGDSRTKSGSRPTAVTNRPSKGRPVEVKGPKGTEAPRPRDPSRNEGPTASSGEPDERRRAAAIIIVARHFRVVLHVQEDGCEDLGSTDCQHTPDVLHCSFSQGK